MRFPCAASFRNSSRDGEYTRLLKRNRPENKRANPPARTFTLSATSPPGRLIGGATAHRPHKSPHLRGVFLSGRRFHAAGHIHAERPDPAHSVTDVFWCQAAGQEDRFAEALRFNRQVPIEGAAGAAASVRRPGVKQISVGVKLRDKLERTGVADAKGLHAQQTKTEAKIRRFLPVKLKQGQAAFANGARDEVLVRVHKNADAQDK